MRAHHSRAIGLLLSVRQNQSLKSAFNKSVIFSGENDSFPLSALCVVGSIDQTFAGVRATPVMRSECKGGSR